MICSAREKGSGKRPATGFVSEATRAAAAETEFVFHLSLLNLEDVLGDRGVRPDALLVHEADEIRLAKQQGCLRLPFVHLFKRHKSDDPTKTRVKTKVRTHISP